MIRLHEAYLILGSNLGDRLQFINAGLSLINLTIGKVIDSSSIYETLPWGVTDHDSYLNMVIKVETILPPGRLMLQCLRIERQLGRRRKKEILPRELDIDILYYDDKVIQQKKVIIPHPRLHLRRFALIPLTEIAPNHLHPVFHLSNTELLKRCTDDLTVKKIEQRTEI